MNKNNDKSSSLDKEMRIYIAVFIVVIIVVIVEAIVLFRSSSTQVKTDYEMPKQEISVEGDANGNEQQPVQ